LQPAIQRAWVACAPEFAVWIAAGMDSCPSDPSAAQAVTGQLYRRIPRKSRRMPVVLPDGRRAAAIY
jgi:hypothetical protein